MATGQSPIESTEISPIAAYERPTLRFSGRVAELVAGSGNNNSDGGAVCQVDTSIAEPDCD